MSYIGNPLITAAFVTDQFSGTGSQTVYTMSVAPANGAAAIVAVSGVLQDPSTYSVNGTTLTFSAAPPSGTGNISVRYLGIPATGVTTTAYRTVTEFTATAGQTVFTPPSYVAGFLDVYRNGVKLAAADFTATNGTTVTLTSAATAGDIVTTVSFQVSSVINAIPATAGAVNNTYLATGAVQQTNLGTNVASNGPVFSASASSIQTVPNTTVTKILFDTKQFDTNNNFNTSLGRFTPTVAGYYQLSATVGIASYPFSASLFKNGSNYYSTQFVSTYIASIGTAATVSLIVYANGSTDYFEIYAYQASGSSTTSYGSNASIFTGALIRAA
jgi:hypothetical protein